MERPALADASSMARTLGQTMTDEKILGPFPISDKIQGKAISIEERLDKIEKMLRLIMETLGIKGEYAK